jgi:hypothetical protein
MLFNGELGLGLFLVCVPTTPGLPIPAVAFGVSHSWFKSKLEISSYFVEKLRFPLMQGRKVSFWDFLPRFHCGIEVTKVRPSHVPQPSLWFTISERTWIHERVYPRYKLGCIHNWRPFQFTHVNILPWSPSRHRIRIADSLQGIPGAPLRWNRNDYLGKKAERVPPILMLLKVESGVSLSIMGCRAFQISSTWCRFCVT